MIVAGIGFRKSASLAALRDAFAQAGGARAEAIATAADKATAATFQAFADECGLPILGIALADLARQPVLTQSDRVAVLYGTGSLAEAAALAGAGPGARLLAPRVTSQDGSATAALAERKFE